MNKEQEILKKATHLFMRYGLKSLSVDDLCKELKISKKTLYKNFADKSSLIKKIMESFVEEDKRCMLEINDKSITAVEEMISCGKYINDQIKDLNPSIHFDLQKYYPEAWLVFDAYKNDFIYSQVIENIKRGILEGYYRNDINPKIIAKIYVVRIDFLFDSVIFPPQEFTFEEVNNQVAGYHMNGLMNERGRTLLKKITEND